MIYFETCLWRSRVNFWFLLQLLVNVILFTGIVGMWIRMNRPAKEDPRLSKGLQLLQSKIAVLEDLSDRTETQVNQLTLLLEQKVKDIQSKIQSSEKQIAKIDLSMQKSLEVAKIFQDKIPHGEIVERQNTIKYVKAARLAHQGLSVDEIAQQVTELSRGEIEFIAKINRSRKRGFAIGLCGHPKKGSNRKSISGARKSRPCRQKSS